MALEDRINDVGASLEDMMNFDELNLAASEPPMGRLSQTYCEYSTRCMR